MRRDFSLFNDPAPQDQQPSYKQDAMIFYQPRIHADETQMHSIVAQASSLCLRQKGIDL